MINKNFNSHLALIPARKGSKGLPGKNKKLFLGKPLIYWTIKNAIESKIFTNVVVSTDCKEIAKVSKFFGALVPFLRPQHLAQDNSTSLDVAIHALDFFLKEKNFNFDFITLLEPTSPIREKDDLKNMFTLLLKKQSKFDAIVSLGEMNNHPSYALKISKDDSISPFFNKKEESRRQLLDTAYFPFGVGYMCKTEVLRRELSFYPKRTTGYVIKPYQCMEIDTEIDFICNQFLGEKFLK